MLVVVGAAAGESFLRIHPHYLPNETLFRMQTELMRDDGLKSQPHDSIGYLWPPDERNGFSAGDFGFTYTTDEHGFRNPAPWPATADIVVLGDSQAFGFGVDDEDAWVRRIAERLPDRDVVNLGLVGAAPQQFLRVFETYGASLRPKVVIVGFLPGNVLYSAQLFDEWLASGKSYRLDVRRSPGAPELRRDGVASTLKAFLRQSYLARSAYHVLKSAMASVPARTIDFADGGRVRLMPTSLEAAPAAPSAQRDIDRVIDAFVRLRAAVQEAGGELVMVPFPTKEEVHLPLLGEAAPPEVAPFIAEFQRLGIPYVDLTPGLQASAAQGDRLFLEIDIHSNPQGYQRVADIVVEHLLRDRARYGLIE